MRAAASDAASRTSLGTAGCRWGVLVRGGPPWSSGLELWRFTLFWPCWLRFGEGVGGWAPLGVHPSCGSLCWGGGRRSSRAAFSGRCWITLQRAASSSRCPGPSLCSPLSRCLSAGLWGRPRSVPLLPSRARGPDVHRGAAGVARRSGCRLTGRSQTTRDRAGCVWGSSFWDFQPAGRTVGTLDLLLGPFSSSGNR